MLAGPVVGAKTNVVLVLSVWVREFFPLKVMCGSGCQGKHLMKDELTERTGVVVTGPVQLNLRELQHMKMKWSCHAH